MTEAAVEQLYPDSKTCERGDLIVEFGSALDERATGPRSNVVSYITGAWASSGFSGLKGRFKRKDLISYGHANIGKAAVRFRRISNGATVVIEYDPSVIVRELDPQLEFPESCRFEIAAILNDSSKTLKVL